MKFKEALKICRKVGTAHATGDSLRAMYASLIALKWGMCAESTFSLLQRNAENDAEISALAQSILRDCDIVETLK